MSKLREKISEYKDAILSSAIYDILKLILIFIFSSCITTIPSHILINLSNIKFLITYQIPIIILIVTITFFIILEVYTRTSKHHPQTPIVEADYKILKREMSFTYGKDESKYELYLTVKSNINGLNRINGKYTWSGSDPASLTCKTSHCKLIPLTRKDSFIEYQVELGKNYKKGKHAECKIVGNMPDSRHTFIPFFSTQITEETKELIIHICIPPKYGVTEIIREEIAIVRNSNENSEVVTLDVNGKNTWKIQNPKLFYKYSVRWEL